MGLQDDEKLEVFLSHYASLVQPIMYSLGQVNKNSMVQNPAATHISDDFITKVLDLVF